LPPTRSKFPIATLAKSWFVGGVVADFVQKNRAVIALLKFTDALHRCPSERRVRGRTSSSAVVRNGRAINRAAKVVRLASVMINGARDEFLAAPVSPVIRAVTSEAASCPINLNTVCISALPTMPTRNLHPQRLIRNHCSHVPAA
jgi:hypothetical protein